MKKIKKIMIIVAILMVSIYQVNSYAGAVAPEDRPGGTGSQITPGQNPYAAEEQRRKEEQERLEREKREEEERRRQQEQQQQQQGTSDIKSVINPDDYKPSTLTQADVGDFSTKVGAVLGALRLFGTAVCVISLMVIGIRYMFASTQEKASYKETMVPYLIGAVMLFVIPTVLQIIFDLVAEIHD
ncbi:MAG: hypothetical protein HFJ27_01795 [Clostridia bacterium]|nr:hypothetical protein [Clostridia bacterium]